MTREQQFYPSVTLVRIDAEDEDFVRWELRFLLDHQRGAIPITSMTTDKESTVTEVFEIMTEAILASLANAPEETP